MSVHPLKLASVLLSYPTAEAGDAVRGLDRAELDGLPRGARPDAFLAWYAAQPLGELQRDYVETFDFGRERSLHLTYHLHGDRRQRGLALLALKRAYAEAGLELEGTGELPDHLPVMLEFAALAPEPLGMDLLDRHRVAIELVRAGLTRAGSRWLDVLDLVVATMPGVTRRQLARIRRLAAEGPPSEEVGLEPFAPPSVMPPADDLVGWPR